MLQASSHVTAVILAAGTSTRLGRPKQLLDINGEPLVRRVARITADSTVDDVIVVVGNAADEVERSLDGLRIRIVFNPEYAKGQSTSLKAGIGSVSDETGAVVILLGDQPMIRTETIDKIVAVWRKSGNPVVQARYRGTRSHPVLFNRSLFDDLSQVSGDSGASAVIKSHANEIVPVDFDEDVPIDIDTDDDYVRVLEMLGNDHRP